MDQRPGPALTTHAQHGVPNDTIAADSHTGSQPAATAILSAADRLSFLRLQASLGGRIGLAVSALGLGQPVETVGSLRAAVAWSTSKVPVAMAVYDAGLGAAQQVNLTAAITASDNASAQRLWSALGGGRQAATSADRQLRVAGDQRTQTEFRTLRRGFTAFGQTRWSLAEQVRFTAGMACSPAGVHVLDLMNHTVAWQRWGLGAAGTSARLKGGWGPGTRPGVDGGDLDRQMGTVISHGKPMAITIGSVPSDGSHTTGMTNLTAIARWFLQHATVAQLPARPRCR